MRRTLAWRLSSQSRGARNLISRTSSALDSGGMASLALAGLLFFEMILFGGNRADLALSFSAAYGVLLALALTTPLARTVLPVLPVWPAVCGLFCLLLLAVLAALAPTPLGGSSLWRAAGMAPRAAVFPLGVLIECAKLLGLACVFTLGALLAAERRRMMDLMRILTAMALAFEIVALILHFAFPTGVFGWSKPLVARGRLSGLFSSPNTAATAFGMFTLLAFGGLVRAGGTVQGLTASVRVRALLLSHPVEAAGFVAGLLCLLLSGSRGGVAAFGVAFLLLLLRFAWTRSGGQVVLWAAAGAAGLIALGAGGLVMHRAVGGTYGHDDRLAWAGAAWRMFLSSPLEGSGLGSLAMGFHAMATDATFAALDWAGSAHNVYLQWLAEGGLLCALPLVCLMGVILSTAIGRLLRQRSGSVWLPTLLAIVGLVLGHSFLDYPLQEPAIAAVFSLLLGCAFAYGAADAAASTGSRARPGARAAAGRRRPAAS